MADGGQRLLDVIDDPNALESFLGGLTADTELLPSAETVDNVVASLARSLDDNEYEVDSPNETLFDTLDSSSNHLTDISRSYVPSDFDHHVAVQNDGYSNNLDGFSNGNNVIRGNLAQQHEQQQNPVQTSGCDQFIGSSSNNNNNSTIINSVISGSSVNTTNNTTVTGSTLKQIIASSVPNCDPSKSTSNFVQAGQQQLQLSQNSVSSASNNLGYAFSSQDLQHHSKQIEVSHNQLNQVTSLSSVSLEGHQLQQNVPNSTNNLISVVGAGHENGSGSGLTNSTSSSGFQVVTNQQQQQSKAQQQNVSASNLSQTINAVASVQVVSSGAASGGGNTVISSGASTIASGNVTLSTSTNVVGSNLASIQQQQQYLANTSTHQLMAGQTVSIPSMSVSAPQLIANSQGGLIATAGQNILQQIQSAAGGQSYIAMEQPTALIATGPSTFGTNLALMATGGTPTYTVLPTTQQFLTNAIIPQPTIQTLTKGANGAYYQTTGTQQIVATSTVNALQNVGTAVTTSNTTTPPVTSVSSSTEANSSGTGSQQSLPTSIASTSVSDGVMTQLIQQSQQQITPQQSFAIGNAGSLGQVVVSQVSSLGTMTTPQQAHQLAGTIVVNQYGQPMLLPTASTAQAGLQLILRQQPTQPQVLTIQTPQGTQAGTAASGKPIVRYVSQMPQVAQTSGYGLQQIQTANGPTWVAVRYPQASQASQFSQIQTDSIISAASTIQSQISNSGQSQFQLQTQQSQQVQIQLQQQAQQLFQQAQQQQQMQLQNNLAQSNLSNQQQVQGTNQLQMQAQQQSLQSQQQVQLQNQQGQLSNVQQQVQSQQTLNHQQTSSQAPIPMDTQNTSTPTQQNQFMNRSLHQSMNNSPQTPQSRDLEQQQVSVPDSSSEPPPPKKAKTKSKSSKKKVTLDLEQLLKQSGIMDEDLQDDMSFDFGFGSMMDTQPNGLPLSPQVPPPAQIPVINTTETPKKSKKKSSSKKSPAQPPPPSPVVLPPPPIATPSPSAKKKRSSPKKKNAPPPPSTPPPPLPPPPPIVTPTKSKSSKKKSSNSSGNVNENQKAEPKTASAKKTVPPKKVSSLDTLLATIDAVAAAAGASYAASPHSSPSSFPPPPPPVSQTTTPSRKPTPSPKSKSKSKSKSAKNSAPSTPSSKMENYLPPVPNSTYPVPSSTSSQSVLPPSSLSYPQSQSSVPVQVAPTLNTIAAPPPSISPSIPTSRTTGSNLTNGSTSVTTSQTGLTRIVQTIQLTPQNQQLLRNIQGEVQRLCAIPARNESEQAALQKLVNLQQQVIATGTPVPNPTHLNNLAQIVNVESSISLATPSATVPSFDTASSSSSSTIAPLVFPCESDLNPSPVSSTVVATTAMSVLANSNLINSSSKLISSKLSGNSGSSPVLATTTGGGGGSSSNNGACIIVGSPSVSSTASPDSTSNLASNLNVEQCTILPSTITTSATNNPTPNINSGGMGSIVMSNVKGELGQLVASLSVAPAEDKTKDNTQAKSFHGVTTTSTSVPVPTQSSVSFSQHLQHVPPPPSSYAPPTFSTRSVFDEKKAEEQRQANLKAEEEKRARWKKEEFEMLLQRDQQYVVKPDYEVPFNSKKDAVERLMKYHIYRDRNDMDFEEFDAEFGNNAGILLEKFSVMMSKYRNLLLKESTKEVGCAERVMLERMFVSEEKLRMEQDRLAVAQGDVLDLPPPPDSWVPKIKEMVDKEMIEFEPQDPVVSQQVQSAVDSIIGCGNADTNSYLLEEGDKIEYDAFGVPINSSGYAGLAASSADIDEAVRSILS